MKSSKSAVLLKAVLFGLVFICGPSLYTFGISRCYYGLKYSVSPSNVTIEDRPQSCDYDWSPIGKKGCHYEKDVIVFPEDKGVVKVLVTWRREND